ncbi:unnamed protein product [Rangifer tarandus platyrhynchus]|uniref:Uncharacterized protein n=1 Tax=Rangifer tarandus platyrhynchus TaxID=3082113 RepID=A0AC59ZVR7_RANTA
MPGDGAPARDSTPAATRAATPSSVSSTAVAPLTSDPLKRLVFTRHGIPRFPSLELSKKARAPPLGSHGATEGTRPRPAAPQGGGCRFVPRAGRNSRPPGCWLPDLHVPRVPRKQSCTPVRTPGALRSTIDSLFPPLCKSLVSGP